MVNKMNKTLVVAALLSSAGAFVPHRPLGSSSFTTGAPKVAAPVLAPSTTALHMNLFDRFTRVAKSNLNNILKNLEDPEKIMTQALEDMQVSAPFDKALLVTTSTHVVPNTG